MGAAFEDKHGARQVRSGKYSLVDLDSFSPPPTPSGASKPAAKYVTCALHLRHRPIQMARMHIHHSKAPKCYFNLVMTATAEKQSLPQTDPHMHLLGPGKNVVGHVWQSNLLLVVVTQACVFCQGLRAYQSACHLFSLHDVFVLSVAVA